MSRAANAWDLLLAVFAQAFTQPSFALFDDLVCAWVLCPGRRTVTRMIRVMHPAGRRCHDAYHRFLRAGAWSTVVVWELLVISLVDRLSPEEGKLQVDLDDTLFHKTGRKVEGAGIFRDAVRSRAKSVVYALGLNLVVLNVEDPSPMGWRAAGTSNQCPALPQARTVTPGSGGSDDPGDRELVALPVLRLGL